MARLEDLARDCEPGTLRLDVWEVQGEPDVVYVYEVYKDAEAFEDHTKNEPVQKFNEIMSGLSRFDKVWPGVFCERSEARKDRPYCRLSRDSLA